MKQRPCAATMPCEGEGPTRPEPAHSTAPMRARAGRRLRRLQLALHGQAQPLSVPAASSAAPSSLSSTGTGAGETVARLTTPRARDDLAARALSGMLCDEINAARCRTTVRRSPLGYLLDGQRRTCLWK